MERAGPIYGSLLGEGGRWLEKLQASVPELASRGEEGLRLLTEQVRVLLTNLEVAVALDAPHVYGASVRWLVTVERAQDAPVSGIAPALIAIGRRLAARGLSTAATPQSGDGVSHPVREDLELGAYLGAGLQALEAPQPPHPPPPLDPEVRRYLDLVLGPQRGEALALTAHWLREDGPRASLLRLGRAQHEIGEAWIAGEVSVAKEHRATAITQVALGALDRLLDGGRAHLAGRALLGAAGGDTHSTGAHIAADLMDLAGFEVVFLGGDTPAEAFVEVVTDTAPDVVGIGAATLRALISARATAAEVRAARPSAFLVAGGWAARIAGEEVLSVDQVLPFDFDGRLTGRG